MKKNNDELVEVFDGTPWQAGMVKSLIENANIKVFLRDEIIGTFIPWNTAPGGAGSVRVFVSKADYDLSIQIVKEFENTQK